MEDLTLEQINELASAYCDMARSLNEFQVVHWSQLTHEQQLDLNAYQNSLLDRAQAIQMRTTRPAFTNAHQMTGRILEGTHKARTSLQQLDDLPVAINVGAITVALAAYAARANARGIEIALRELDDLTKA
ncbi:hypothetical protein [Spirosoma radiotolerans]|uniref:Uncharacterized protein n=1 Tax=Spirosoma radiotolerans TaxID=1379870 RepID=A0A0E3ZUR3_9BACT|nr:hypothetical protein [Spirosoma radiotolerans]AKD55698.1 hypothetical protein SD10_13095 [Spirosoma radiotolerans]